MENPDPARSNSANFLTHDTSTRSIVRTANAGLAAGTQLAPDDARGEADGALLADLAIVVGHDVGSPGRCRDGRRRPLDRELRRLQG